ncbi:MAG: thioredoxin domain-containing protein [Candidatus Poribacteria bacterium]|nr:thioredoxin domain-containing protein [Candidatus Poribacteria bacterium]
MRPVVAEVALEYRDVFSFVKLDVRTQPEKTTEYRIRGTPTYIVFRDGEMVEGFDGAMPKAELVQSILGILEIDETE